MDNELSTHDRPLDKINDTLTNVADHCEHFSHDTINRHLRHDRVTPRVPCEGTSP